MGSFFQDIKKTCVKATFNREEWWTWFKGHALYPEVTSCCRKGKAKQRQDKAGQGRARQDKAGQGRARPP